MSIQHHYVDLKLFLHCVPAEIRLREGWILVVCTLDLGCVDVGFGLHRRCLLVGWMLNFGCLDVK